MILILGGTQEARALAEALKTPFLLSLAGVTRGKPRADIPVRMGGFGGADGLADFLQHHEISAIIDATHPFASRISHNAALAAGATNTPLLRLERPVWPARANWQTVASLADAAAALPAGARAFLTVGSRHLAPFLPRKDVWFLTRAIEPPPRIPEGMVHLQRPPFTRAGELEILRRYRISHLVTKNAGGAQTVAKLDAAEALGLPVIMVNRPQLPLVETAENLQDALEWIRQNAGQRGTE